MRCSVLENDPPVIELRAGKSKRRRAEYQPIRLDLASLLRPWLAGKHSGEAVFSSMPEKTALMIRADLRRARARWMRAAPEKFDRRARRNSDFLVDIDATGRVVDFYCLRVDYVTLLTKGGASAKITQELARHSDPKLTPNTFAKLEIHDLAAALDSLPAHSGTRKTQERSKLRATGTDDAFADPRQKSRPLRREVVRMHAVNTLEKTQSILHATPCRQGRSATRYDPTRGHATKPPDGLEPSTCGLQNRCSAN